LGRLKAVERMVTPETRMKLSQRRLLALTVPIRPVGLRGNAGSRAGGKFGDLREKFSDAVAYWSRYIRASGNIRLTGLAQSCYVNNYLNFGYFGIQ
ncbi:hypothetical protein ACFOEX_12540, partial [Camelimonas abortus]